MDFLWRRWARHVIRSGLQVAISWVGADTLAEWGVTVDIGAMTIALAAALEGLRNWLKHKKKLSWLP